MFSKTQIDKLGDRLREGAVSDDDLRMLDEYRRAFEETYQEVVKAIRQKTGLLPIGRPEKSTSSIIYKLRRAGTRHARLSQIQDIAGCRLVVEDISQQEKVVSLLKEVYPGAIFFDRRVNPSHGYRAVHVVVRIRGMQVEVQVRSFLQHSWAEYCEKLSDQFGIAVKYGGGAEKPREQLADLSLALARIETHWEALSPRSREFSKAVMKETLNLHETYRSLEKRLEDLEKAK